MRQLNLFLVFLCYKQHLTVNLQKISKTRKSLKKNSNFWKKAKVKLSVGECSYYVFLMVRIKSSLYVSTKIWHGAPKSFLLAEASFLLRSLDWRVLEKRPQSWIETHFDPTAVHNLGRHSSKRMPHDMFADCDLSPLCSAHSFIALPLLLSEPTQHQVSRVD